MAKHQLDNTLVRCIKTDGTNRIRYVKRYIANDEIYMKRVKLMVAEVQSPPVKKLSKAKQDEIKSIDKQITALKKGEQTEEKLNKISDLEQLKQNIADGRD